MSPGANAAGSGASQEIADLKAELGRVRAECQCCSRAAGGSLTSELEHRGKNVLAIIQSIIMHTLHPGDECRRGAHDSFGADWGTGGRREHAVERVGVAADAAGRCGSATRCPTLSSSMTGSTSLDRNSRSARKRQWR